MPFSRPIHVHSDKVSLHCNSVPFSSEEVDSWPLKVTFLTLAYDLSAKANANAI